MRTEEEEESVLNADVWGTRTIQLYWPFLDEAQANAEFQQWKQPLTFL